ncbi:MAG: hypothetical protein WCC60_22180 [Ilumatobacteraceae bacterium]
MAAKPVGACGARRASGGGNPASWIDELAQRCDALAVDISA